MLKVASDNFTIGELEKIKEFFDDLRNYDHSTSLEKVPGMEVYVLDFKEV